MSSNNNLTTVKQKPKFSVAITTDGYKKLINNTLRDPGRANRFIAAITSAVAVNPALQECDAGTILAGALLGESLNLSPSPQLGQYYLVPFDCKVKGSDGKVVYITDEDGKRIPKTEKKAQFILGYKGYIQLAIRSGYYSKLNVIEIKDEELIKFDPLNEVIECSMIDDFEKREAAPTIGYYAMFEYVNGFRKALYWSKSKMVSHADAFSKAFSAKAYEQIQNGEISDRDMWKYSSFWYKNFDDMAKKTMLRQLISKWGVMSTEMQEAFDKDISIADVQNGTIVDIPSDPQLPEGDNDYTPDIAQPEATEVVENIDLSEL